MKELIKVEEIPNYFERLQPLSITTAYMFEGGYNDTTENRHDTV